jgi:tetratricopeptide (TPR) repeat protein
VLALDPQFGLAYGFKAQEEAYGGDVAKAYATIDACRTALPRAMFCISFRAEIDGEEGRSDELAEDARRIIAHDPNVDMGYYRLAQAQGRAEAMKSAMELAWAHLVVGERAEAEATDGFALHVLSGDFEAAERDLRALDRILTSNPNRPPHAMVAKSLVLLHLETGRHAEAAKVAEDFLRAQDGWLPDPRVEDSAMARDPTPFMLGVLRREGKRSNEELSAAREAWIAAWRRQITPPFVRFLWLHAYAVPSETAAESAEAVAALTGFPAPPRFAPETLADAHIGRVLLRAGKLDEALPHLRRGARACLAMLLPIEHTHARYTLGEALEKAGDAKGACDEYRAVLERWGRAPHSRTADAARARTRALACP